MNFPITDEHVSRALRGFYGPGFLANQMTWARMKDALTAALDRRKGERDRRKVQDRNGRPNVATWSRSLSPGRRKGDNYSWQNLPLAEAPIQVSEGMRKVGGFHVNNIMGNSMGSLLGPGYAETIYRAMEAKRIEEQKKRERACNRCLGTGRDMVHGTHPGPALHCHHCGGTGEAPSDARSSAGYVRHNECGTFRTPDELTGLDRRKAK